MKNLVTLTTLKVISVAKPHCETYWLSAETKISKRRLVKTFTRRRDLMQGPNVDLIFIT